MKKYFKIVFNYYSMFIKKQLVYRLNASILFADIIMQLGGIIFLWAIYTKVPNLSGWSYPQMLFFYGFAQITFSLFSIFFGNIFRLGERYIIRGELNRLLVRPINSLFQLLIEEMYLGDAGALIVGVALLGYSVIKLQLKLTLLKVGLGVFFVLVAVSIFVGFFLILSSLNFWFLGTHGFQALVFRTINVSRYPFNVYGKIFKIIFTWIIPFAFIGYFPALLFMEGILEKSLLFAPLIAIVLNICGYMVWKKGLKRYNAPGW